MDGEGETPVTTGGAPPPGVWTRLPASSWAGVAIVGAILFVLGIWLPAWRDVPGGVGLNYVAAAAGAVMMVVGVTFAVRARESGRPTPVEAIPGVEVFRPTTFRHRSDPSDSDEDQA
jgi:hypothetical protein